jgi:ADP-ribose pyrophosphatase YjhB (NUDIX family)
MGMTEVLCTVDIVLLTLLQGRLKVALLKRNREPFMGVLVLPGGFIHPAEDRDARDAALRVLKEKTGIDLVRGKPRPSGRGQERGRQSRSLPLALVRCLLLLDVLPNNGARRTTAATGEVGRRPQRSAP